MRDLATARRDSLDEYQVNSTLRQGHDNHCWLIRCGVYCKIVKIWPDKTIEVARFDPYDHIVWHGLINMEQLKH